MTEKTMGEIYLEPEEEKIKNAAEIAAVSESMEKFIFTVFYALSDKEIILSELKRIGAVIVNHTDEDSAVTVKMSMEQLAAIKTLECVERVEMPEQNKAKTINMKDGMEATPMVVSQVSNENEISLLCYGDGGSSGSDCDCSNDISTAIYLPLSTWKSGSIHCPYAETWYRFTASVSNASQYRIYTTGSLDTMGYLYDANGSYITQNDDNGGLNFSITRSLTYGATYYICVRAYGSNTGNFSLRVDYTTSSSSGNDNSDDGSNDMSTAITLPLSTYVGGSIECPCTEKWYRFTASNSNASQYTIYTSGSLDTVGYLYNSNGTLITSNDDSGANMNFSITRSLTYGATYYLKVKAYGSNTGSYNVRVDYQTSSAEPDDNDCSNEMSSAINLSLNSWQGGEICCPGAEIWYKFTPSTTAYYTIYTVGSLDTYGYLYDANGTEIDHDDDDGSSLNFKMVQRLAANQTYYIKAKAFGNNTGFFSIAVTSTVFVESVSINQSYVYLDKGKTANLTATVTPSYATNKTLRWETGDASVATVSQSGVVTAQGTGSTCICAYSQDGSNKYSCCQVNVKIPATSVSVTPATKSMYVGDTADLTATVHPTNAQNKAVTWCSSDPEIVSVDYYSGKITANSAGTAIITATTVYGGLTDTCVVNVEWCEHSNNTDTAIELSLNSWQSGEICCPEAEMWYKFTPSTTAYYTIYSSGAFDVIGYLYDSDGNEIVHDDDGGGTTYPNFKIVRRLTKNQTYYIKVKAYFSTAIGRYNIRVTNNVSVQSVTINKESITLNKGSSTKLTATVRPEYATNKTLKWESSDESVVEVDRDTGEITAVDRGYATICAYAQDGSNKRGCCEVEVKVPVERVTIDPPNRMMHVGTSDWFTATVCPENANNKQLLWSSSNTDVATIDETTGYVTAEAVGTTKIKATAKDGSDEYGECSLTVKPAIPVQGITICPDTHTMNVGETTRLSYDIFPADATNKSVTWCSSDTSVAQVNWTTGRILAKKAGSTTITVTTNDGSFVASCLLKVIIDTVTVQKDGAFNKVVFNSSGKVWRCINHDMIYDEQYRNNTTLTNRSNHNFFTYYDEYDHYNVNHIPKEYTDDEIKLLYAIDPYGVADYVRRYAGEIFKEVNGEESVENALRASIGYKDRIFKMLFKREPKYFARTIDGVWYEVIEYEEINDVLSESETIFGMHPIYDTLTGLMALNFAIDIAKLIWHRWPFVGDVLDQVANIFKISLLLLTTDDEYIKEELIAFGVDELLGIAVENCFKNTFIEWAYNVVSLVDSLSEVVDSMTVENNYCKNIINFCANDLCYDIKLQLRNGVICNINEVNELIN